jgi:hypothetical protein
MQWCAGFVIFIFLLLYIMRSPPTPLAIRSDDVESLWVAVSRRLDNTSSTIMRQLHALQAEMVSHISPSNWPTGMDDV